MTSRVFVLLLLFAGRLALAQGSYPACTYTYFKGSKKVASSQCFDTDSRFGQACAFAPDGREIYRHGLRRIAGHESVTFTFYPSGAVRRAEMSSAPDGGIQWYRSTTEFAEDGKVTSVQNNHYDDRPTLHTLSPAVLNPSNPSTLPKPPAASECAPLLQGECWFVNRSRRAAIIVVRHKTTAEQYVLRLPANGKDTLKSHSFALAQHYQTPANTYTFSALPAKDTTGLRLEPLPRPYRNLGPNLRRYYYVVR